MNVVVNIESHILDDWQHGAWCDNCNLPAMSSVTSVILDANTLHTIDRSRLHVCTDCGHHHYERTR